LLRKGKSKKAKGKRQKAKKNFLVLPFAFYLLPLNRPPTTAGGSDPYANLSRSSSLPKLSSPRQSCLQSNSRLFASKQISDSRLLNQN